MAQLVERDVAPVAHTAPLQDPPPPTPAPAPPAPSTPAAPADPELAAEIDSARQLRQSTDPTCRRRRC